MVWRQRNVSDDDVWYVLNQHNLTQGFIVIAQRHNSKGVDMSLHSEILSRHAASKSLCLLLSEAY